MIFMKNSLSKTRLRTEQERNRTNFIQQENSNPTTKTHESQKPKVSESSVDNRVHFDQLNLNIAYPKRNHIK